MIGYDTNLSSFTIGMLSKHFGKLWVQLFQSFPFHMKASDPVPLDLLQSLSSNMLRIADIAPFLLPFSRGVAFATRGLSVSATHGYLTHRAITA